jgi:hypothetical protein
MPHPCKSSADHNPTAALHACVPGSDRTLCDLPVDPDWVDRADGYTAVCSWCYPMVPNDRSEDREYLAIGSRLPSA